MFSTNKYMMDRALLPYPLSETETPVILYFVRSADCKKPQIQYALSAAFLTGKSRVVDFAILCYYL